MPKQKTKRRIFSRWSGNKKFAVLFMLAFALVGSYFLIKSFAAVSPGNVDVNTCTTISGWAYDKDAPSKSINVDIYITQSDSPQVGRDYGVRLVTNAPRLDVNKAFSITGNHGFSLGVPTKFKNNQKWNAFVFAIGINAAGATTGENPLIGKGSWTCAPNTTIKAQGAVDVANCNTVSGWAADRDSPAKSINVHVYIGGPAGSGQFGAVLVANQSRPDVNAALGITGNHGFSYAVPSKFRDGKYYPIYVYAIGINSAGTADGDNPLLAQKNCGTPPPPPVVAPPPATATNTGLLSGLQAIAGCTKITLRQGSSGGCVKILQTALNNLVGAGLATDGQFGSNTNSAVRRYQAANGLSVDGIVGPQTWGAITSGRRGFTAGGGGGGGGSIGGGGAPIGGGGGGGSGAMSCSEAQRLRTYTLMYSILSDQNAARYKLWKKNPIPYYNDKIVPRLRRMAQATYGLGQLRIRTPGDCTALNLYWQQFNNNDNGHDLRSWAQDPRSK